MPLQPVASLTLPPPPLLSPLRLPEAYSFAALLQFWHGAEATQSGVGLPRAVVQEPQRFAWLLPGGCKREP
jgi:hypothetical protein